MNFQDLIVGKTFVPPLSVSQIHVWNLQTDLSPDSVADLSRLLNVDESACRDKFRFERDQRRFAVCRGALRLLLGAYQRVEPASVRFEYGPQGKPAISSSHATPVRFNVSHSGDLCLLGFALDRDVGVDIEAHRTNVNFEELAARVFSLPEQNSLSALPSARRANLFYEYWSCKEACIKADGRGLSIPLQQFSIGPFPENPQWRVVHAEGPQIISPKMRVRIPDVASGYSAAIAAEGEDWDVLLCN